MKIVDILDEGGNSDATRYNSEVGLLFGLIGKGNFNPKFPEKSIPSSKLISPEKTYSDIKKLLYPKFDADIFNKWANKAPQIKNLIIKKEGSFPDQIGWTGGSNSTGLADIVFSTSGPLSPAGISLKDGSPSLKNLSYNHLGLGHERGVELFYNYAKDEFISFKTQVIKYLLEIAKSNPNKKIFSREKSGVGDQKYYLIYNSKNNKFFLFNKGIKTEKTESEILNDLHKTKPENVVFGYWMSNHWNIASKFAEPLYKKLGVIFEKLIESKLKSDINSLHLAFAISEQPYFFANTKSVWYVPSKSELQDLQIKKINYSPTPDNVSMVLNIVVGRPDSENNATGILYIGYRQDHFNTQPKTTIQQVKNYQNLGWDFLGDIN